jgi:hypothetical protein
LKRRGLASIAASGGGAERLHIAHRGTGRQQQDSGCQAQAHSFGRANADEDEDRHTCAAVGVDEDASSLTVRPIALGRRTGTQGSVNGLMMPAPREGGRGASLATMRCVRKSTSHRTRCEGQADHAARRAPQRGTREDHQVGRRRSSLLDGALVTSIQGRTAGTRGGVAWGLPPESHHIRRWVKNGPSQSQSQRPEPAERGGSQRCRGGGAERLHIAHRGTGRRQQDGGCQAQAHSFGRANADEDEDRHTCAAVGVDEDASSKSRWRG